MASDSESTPLLAEHRDAIYSRFSIREKRTIVALVSWSALLPLFASGTFIPSIPQIAKDLNSDAQTISFAVSFSICSMAVGSLTFATYSAYYGRRAAYLAGCPLLLIGSLGVSVSRNVPEMMVWRCIQALGTSGGLSVGAAVIGDIYKLTERGTAMGIFFGATMLGPALSPAAGGFGAHYFSWRWTQFGLAIAGFFTLVMLFAFLPETCHPNTRGMEKERQTTGAESNTFIWVWLNPFRCFSLLRSPNILLITLCGTVCLVTDYCLLVPISYTLGMKYNITNELLIGACYFPLGIGNMIGAPIAGRLSDYFVIRAIEKHGPEGWAPEERLKAAIFGVLVPVPLSILLSGIFTAYVPGPLGLVLNLGCFFMNGVGVVLVLTPMSAYTVDILHDRSAEVLAATMGLRAMLVGASITLIFPGINNLGIVATDSISAGLVWCGCSLLLATIKHGKGMREWLDIGYTTGKTAF